MNPAWVVADTVAQAAKPSPVDTLATVTVLFALALAVALLVERAIEVGKSLFDYWDCKNKRSKVWTARAQALKTRLERRLRVFEYVPIERIQPIINRVNDMLLNKQTAYAGNTLVISGDLVRAAWVRIATKIVGIALGIGVAFWLKIDFMKLWEIPTNLPAQLLPSGLPEQPIPSGWPAILASGIAIGLGAGPVHKLITTIEKKQKDRQQQKEAGKKEDN